MTPITRKYIQQSLLVIRLGNQLTPSGGNIRDDNDGNAANGGKFRHFQGGSIYWKESLGARVVRGSIFNRYRDLGFEHPRGTSIGLGFPIGDEKPGIHNPNNRYSEFEHGVLYWNSATNNVSEVRPISIFHYLLEVQITQIIRTALGGTMVGGFQIVPETITARIQSVQPYHYRQMNYPVGDKQFELFTNRRYIIAFTIPFNYTPEWQASNSKARVPN